MRECKRCGKPFESISGTKLYCSIECSIATDRERVKIKQKEKIEKACECCGKTFIVARYSGRIYCTDKCRRDMTKSLGEPKEKKVVANCRPAPKAGLCSEERSLISPDYARNFICDFVLGKEQEKIGQGSFNFEEV